MSTPFPVGDGFPNEIVGGTALIIPAINSPNFVSGSVGWSINADGTAEFNNGTFRGTLTANSITAGSIGNSTIVNSDIQQGTMEDTNITFDTAGGRLLIYGTTSVAATFTTDGTFVVPGGITSLKVECTGGATGGMLVHTLFNQGGSGGEYACETALAVTAGNSYPYFVGSGTAGGNVSPTSALTLTATASVFAGDSVTVTANGALTYWDTSSGNSIPGSGSTNSIHFDGGYGGDNLFPQNNGHNQGAGGGSSAGPSSGGNDGLPNGTPTSNTGGAGGVAVAGGGAGGKGGNGVNSGTASAGTAGSAPGGGGGSGGFGTVDGASAAGANGHIVVTYVSGRTLIGSISAAAGTDAFSNAYGANFTGQLTAFQPSTSPAVVETWHTATLTNSWTNAGAPVAQYRLLGSPPNSVQVTADLNHAAIAGSSSPFTLPTGYHPASQQSFPLSFFTCTAGYANTATPVLVTVTTAGLVNIQGMYAGTTRAVFSFIISLDA